MFCEKPCTSFKSYSLLLTMNISVFEKPCHKQFITCVYHSDKEYIMYSVLRGGSAPGCDGISANTLKDNINIFVKPLLHLINLSLTTGAFLDFFRLGRVSLFICVMILVTKIVSDQFIYLVFS